MIKKLLGALIISLISACQSDVKPLENTYKVIDLSTIDAAIMSDLKSANVIVDGEENKIEIMDLDQARSEVSLAIYLNRLGKEGWQLTDINSDSFYTFAKPKQEKPGPIQYKVVSPADISKMMLAQLTQQGAVTFSADGKYEIDNQRADPSAAFTLWLTEQQQEQWQLAASDSRGIHILTQPGTGETVFKKLSADDVSEIKKRNQAARKAQQESAAKAKQAAEQKSSEKKK